MKTRVLALLALGTVISACSDNTGPTAGGPATVSLSFTTTGSAGAAFSRSSFGIGANLAVADTFVSGSDTLIVTRARVVLREIELKRVNEFACDSIMGDDDGCEKFEAGPILVDLPLNGSVTTAVSVPIDTGTYDEIEFDIHKPSDDNAADSAFVAQNLGFADISIRVDGTFNGQPFVYESDLNVDQEIELATPLVITDMTAQTNVTLRVDLSTWFRSGTGGLVDPQTGNKGGANEGLVKENIKNSFEAFEDEDRDGDDEDEM